MAARGRACEPRHHGEAERATSQATTSFTREDHRAEGRAAGVAAVAPGSGAPPRDGSLRGRSSDENSPTTVGPEPLTSACAAPASRSASSARSIAGPQRARGVLEVVGGLGELAALEHRLEQRRAPAGERLGGSRGEAEAVGLRG